MLKKLIYCLFAIVLLAGCHKKSYLERSNADRALQDAVKKLNRDPNNEAALDAVPVLYAQIKKDHLARIASLKSSGELDIRDRIIHEYEQLQSAYISIIDCPAAFRLVNPESYATQILEIKQAAAEEYYSRAIAALNKAGRENAKQAHAELLQVLRYQPVYKDVEAKLQLAYDSALVNVVVYPIQEMGYLSGSYIPSAGTGYSKEQMQQDLIQQLGGKNTKNIPAKFYSDREVYRENIKPDWMVDMETKSFDLSSPTVTHSSRSCSKEVQVGTDTAGKPKYQTVYATINSQKTKLNAQSNLSVTIRDVKAGSIVRQESFTETYKWSRETATCTGDRRALSNADLNLLNNGSEPMPSKDFIMGELYKDFLPRVKNFIVKETGW